MTGGLRDLVESNRDVLTLQQELPFPGVEPEKVEEEKKTFVIELEPNNRFEEAELKYLENEQLSSPNDLLKMDPDHLEIYEKNVRKKRNEISKDIGVFKRLKNKTEEGKKKYLENEKKKAILNKYLYTINDILSLPNYQKKGSGIRKYKQPKRNAYKISNSSFGNLSVDVPKLKNEMKLNVRRGGKIIYQADADKSLVDLLTKRFNPKKSYSMNAVKIINDLNLLANLPKHPSSGKSRFIGSGVVYYNNPNELAERMKILVGSMAAGNNSPVLKNDLSMINDEFLKIGAID